LTPNPCVVCNQEIKFGLFLEKALSRGADLVATGHYARVRRGRLLRARDRKKDQSYFLWRLKPEQLSRVLFPIGDYTKKEVRQMARKFGLPTAKTEESQNLCFLASGTEKFLKIHLKQKSGNIVDGRGKLIGRHSGLGFYTIGQRSGIVPLLFSEYQSQGPYFVLKKDLKKNILVVTKKEKDLQKKRFLTQDVNWISGKPKLPLKVKIKVRSSQKEIPAVIYSTEKPSQVLVRLNRAERAITPGQSAVFYRGQEVLGGGIII